MKAMHPYRLFCLLISLFTFTTVLQAQGSGWEVNIYDYRYEMSLYAKLSEPSEPQIDYSKYEVGAFVGEECRGVAQVQSQNGYTWLYLRVYSNSAQGETVQFRIYDKTTSEVFLAKTNLPPSRSLIR